MEEIIGNAIKDSWTEYCEQTPSFLVNAKESHDHGWKEGYEWILTELVINKKIPSDTLKKYMDKLQSWK